MVGWWGDEQLCVIPTVTVTNNPRARSFKGTTRKCNFSNSDSIQSPHPTAYEVQIRNLRLGLAFDYKSAPLPQMLHRGFGRAGGSTIERVNQTMALATTILPKKIARVSRLVGGGRRLEHPLSNIGIGIQLNAICIQGEIQREQRGTHSTLR